MLARGPLKASRMRLFYNNVVKLRQFRGEFPAAALAAGSVNLNIQVADFLAQRVAIDPE